MKNAFLILAHKNFNQLNKLMRFLATGDDHVFIHVDKRSEELYKQVCALGAELKNVHILEKRYKVYWGSYNQIKATAALIRATAQINGFDYAHFISGQDLPVLSKVEMNSFLKNNYGNEYIECVALPNPKWNRNGGMDRMQLFWFDGVLSRFTYRTHLTQNKLGWKRPVGSYKFFGGANWFSLTGKFIQWMNEYMRSNPGYLKRFRFTRNADEIFVQTAIMNSPFAAKVISKDLRYINWTDGPEFPRTLRKNDLPKIFQDKNNLFARKFDESVDAEVIDCALAEAAKIKAVPS